MDACVDTAIDLRAHVGELPSGDELFGFIAQIATFHDTIDAAAVRDPERVAKQVEAANSGCSRTSAESLDWGEAE